jgi:tRNA-dihydrouridine synthase B
MNNMSFWTEKYRIREECYPLFMAAPLDGITDSPMRRLIREYSPDVLLYTEMRHVSCVANEKTGRSLQYEPIEKPLAFQFSGNSTQFLEKAVEKVVERGFCEINFNIGCPAKAVVGSGSGSALMGNLPLLEELLRAFRQAIPKSVLFTLKMRAGFKEKNADIVAQLAVDCGVEGIIIHPRTQPGGFSSLLDYDLVKKIKDETSVPVVFSGNITNLRRAKITHEKTGVDGFMIGRPLWGAPWKIREIMDEAEGKTFLISQKEVIQCAIKHLKYNIEFYGEKGLNPFKKHVPQYIKYMQGAALIRSQLVRSQSVDEMRERLQALLTE